MKQIKSRYTEKKKFYFDETYNYNKIPLDIRANSYLERYNKIIKDYLT